MATRSLHDTVRLTRVIQAQTITSSDIASSDFDTQGFDSVLFMVDFGDIAEMGASPEGSAKIDVLVEHADDDGTGSADTYSNVAATDIDGLTPSSGIVASPTTDTAEVIFGYIGSKRFVRVTLQPTGLSSGGPVHCHAALGHAHLTPVTQG